MDISPIENKNTANSFGKVPKNKGKAVFSGKRVNSTKLAKKLEEKEPFIVVPVEALDDSRDSKKKNNVLKELCEKELADVSTRSSNMFASEVLYDSSSEAFFSAKKSFQEKDNLVQQTILIANEDKGDFVTEPAKINNDICCLIDDKTKKTFIISSSINTYMNDKASPFKDIEVSKKTAELLFTKEKVSMYMKHCRLFCWPFLFFSNETSSLRVNFSITKVKKMKGLALKVARCFKSF